MNQLAILLVLAVSLLATCHRLIDNKYLDISSLQAEWDTDATIKAIEFIQLDEKDEAISMVSKIKNLLDENIELNAHNTAVYTSLISIASSQVKCSKRMVSYAMEFCSILSRRSGTSVDYLSVFMFEYGKKKFGDSIPFVIRNMKNIKENRLSEEELDQVFGITYRWNIGDNKVLLQMLSSLNFASREFDVKGVIETIKYLGYSKEKVTPLDKFNSFMSNHCSGLRKDREYYIDILALAKTLEASLDNVPDKLKKLIEYNRLCASLNRAETQRTLSQILILPAHDDLTQFSDIEWIDNYYTANNQSSYSV